MSDRFVILERLGNGYTLKDTSKRGDGFVVSIPATVNDDDYFIDTETNVGNTRVYVPEVGVSVSENDSDEPETSVVNFQFSGVVPLTQLKIRDASILTIDLGAAGDLTFLNLINNELTDLDINNLRQLEYITLWNNNLTTLDISQCPNLFHVSILDNNLTADAVDAILHNLVVFGLWEGYVNVAGNTSPSSSDDIDILTARDWSVTTDF